MGEAQSWQISAAPCLCAGSLLRSETTGVILLIISTLGTSCTLMNKTLVCWAKPWKRMLWGQHFGWAKESLPLPCSCYSGQASAMTPGSQQYSPQGATWLGNPVSVLWLHLMESPKSHNPASVLWISDPEVWGHFPALRVMCHKATANIQTVHVRGQQDRNSRANFQGHGIHSSWILNDPPPVFDFSHFTLKCDFKSYAEE